MSRTTQSSARGICWNVNSHDFVIEIIDAVQTIIAETSVSIDEGTLPDGSEDIDQDDQFTKFKTRGSSARFGQAGLYGGRVWTCKI